VAFLKRRLSLGAMQIAPLKEGRASRSLYLQFSSISRYNLAGWRCIYRCAK
jgi:hypothetical protein